MMDNDFAVSRNDKVGIEQRGGLKPLRYTNAHHHPSLSGGVLDSLDFLPPQRKGLVDHTSEKITDTIRSQRFLFRWNSEPQDIFEKRTEQNRLKQQAICTYRRSHDSKGSIK